MEMRISDEFHALRIKEIELTADFRAKQEEEREAAREERERLREERKVAMELAAAREKLEKERAHLMTVLEKVRASGAVQVCVEPTAPSVVYEVVLRDNSVIQIESPSRMPEVGQYLEIREPIVTVHLYMPQEYVGAVMTLANQKRGMQLNMAYHGKQVMLTYDMPLGEIVLDFFDKLKSVSRGYASMDYEFKEYRPSDVVKVDILLNGEKVDALSIIVHRSQSQYRGRAVAAKMREIISRQQFDVAIQAAIGGNVIARETIKALRKNVLAKCYGGDITRKRKLLEKQKAGKKRMKQIGSVEVPQEAFLAILQVEE